MDDRTPAERSGGSPPRVLLVGPLPGARWRSISRYAGEIRAHEVLTGVAMTTVEAPWWNPLSMLAGAQRRWWEQPGVGSATRGGFEVVHLTDQALGHHVDRFSSCATLVTCHDMMPWIIPRYFANRAEGIIKRKLLRHSIRGMLSADHILCVSRTTANDLVRAFNFDPERVSVVPNVIADAFQPAPEAEPRLRAEAIMLNSGPRLLTVGHNGPYKNHEWLIRAMAEPCLAGARLLRVGAQLTGKQRALATDLGVASRIDELGHVDDATLAGLYNSCSVLAQPSLYEGFGIPVVEAMACGLPVVCSDGGALPEVVGGAARIVPLESSHRGAELATALAEVIDDAVLRSSLRASGLERARRFRPTVVMPELGAVYCAIAAGRRDRALTTGQVGR